MTKARELEILDVTITQLGPDSYLGPWLRESRLEIEAALRSDIAPSPVLPRQAVAEARQILQDARVEAAEIKSKAAVAVHEMREQAIKQVEQLKASARRALAKAAEAL